jgi:hypothetical protein
MMAVTVQTRRFSALEIWLRYRAHVRLTYLCGKTPQAHASSPKYAKVFDLLGVSDIQRRRTKV